MAFAMKEEVVRKGVKHKKLIHSLQCKPLKLQENVC